MDLKKIGIFLKELRKEKGVTQEQLAEKLGVSGRTVSRWETGSNLPDLSLLVEIAEFYNVEIRELLDGKRESEEKNMEKEDKDALIKLSEYYNEEKIKFLKNINKLLILGTIGVAGYLFFVDSSMEIGLESANICLGVIAGSVVCAFLITSGSLFGMKRIATRPLANEEMVATYIRGMKDAGGWLRTEKEGLMFINHSFSIYKGDVMIEYDSIVSVKPGKSLGVIPNRVIIETKDGTKHKFIVERKYQLELISSIKNHIRKL